LAPGVVVMQADDDEIAAGTPLTTSWPYMPQRGDEPTEVRVSITVRLPVAEIVTRAPEAVHASEPMFIIGPTLAHIGRLKACFKGIDADTPEEAREIRAGLDKTKLKSEYRYPPKARRR
jgi:hypothetical protein